MSILVTADLHLTDAPKDHYRFKAMEWVVECVVERNITTTIILGDLTHNKNYHSDKLVNNVVAVIDAVAANCDVIILLGNHDYVEADTPFFHFVRLLPNVRWINRPTLTEMKEIGQCCFLPHTRDHKREWAAISGWWKDANLFFAHNCFEGATAESGKRLSGIPLSTFPRGQQIISGDIHSPQDIEAHGVYLTYVGSPYTQKFGDDYTPRVLLLENGGMESIEVPGPQKRLITIQSLDELKRFYFAPDDMIKVRYQLRTAECERWPEIKQKILAVWGNAQVSAVLEQETLRQTPERHSLKDDKALVASYGAQQSLSADMLVAGYGLLDAT